jgi:hypothetical protein
MTVRGIRRTGVLLVAASCLAGCGSRPALRYLEGKPTAYGAVEACLTQRPLAGDSGGQNYAGVPPRSDRAVPPFAYRRATGGWIVLRASRARLASILFYPSTGAAARVAQRLRGVGAVVAGSKLLLRRGSLGSAQDQQLVRCFRGS